MFNNAFVKEVEEATGFKPEQFGENYCEFVYCIDNKPTIGLTIDFDFNGDGSGERFYFFKNNIQQVRDWLFISPKEAHELADELLEYERLYNSTMEKLKPIVEKYRLHLI